MKEPGPRGNVLLRMPKSLHTEAKKLAREDGVSLNQFLVAAIAEKIGALTKDEK